MRFLALPHLLSAVTFPPRIVGSRVGPSQVECLVAWRGGRGRLALGIRYLG
jgi:hypothetical protein